MAYYISTTIDDSWEKAEEKVTAALKEIGFGVVSRIDVKATFKEKLDVDYKPYLILGACSPKFAYEALKIEQKIGTMMPCNLVLQENEAGKIEVIAVDPVASLQAVENNDLNKIIEEVKEKLQLMIEQL